MDQLMLERFDTSDFGIVISTGPELNESGTIGAGEISRMLGACSLQAAPNSNSEPEIPGFSNA